MGALPFTIRAKRAGVWARTKDYSRGRDGGRWTRNARCSRENIREVGVSKERKEKEGEKKEYIE